MPPVSEKKSMVSPYKKARSKKANLFLLKGKINTNVMYKYGLMYPEKLMLLKTNICKNKRTIDHKKTATLLICIVY